MVLGATIYAQELYPYGHGLPLWSPEPADQYEVRVGDVGHIDEDGQFHRLFNVTVGADHPLNAGGVPQDFVPLKFNHKLLFSKRDQFPAGAITSKGVKSREAGGGAAVNPTGVVGLGLNYQFDCSRDRGAILVLREPAKKTFVPPAVDFVSYMRRNHDKWYEFATNSRTYGLDCEPEDIILVRGTVKAKSWALAAFEGEAKSVHDLSFDAQAGPMVSANFHYTESSISSAKFQHRIGPAHRRPKVASITSGPPSEVEDDLPEVLAERAMDSGKGMSTDEADDQCVFLQHYKIKYRIFGFKKISAAAGAAELPEGEDGTMSPGVVANEDDADDFIIESMPGDFHYRTPLDDLLDYILEYSKADVAIASDGDLAELFQDDEWPSDVGQYLKQTQPKIDVTEDGAGTLSIGDAVRRTRQAHARQAERLANEQMDSKLKQAAALADADVASGSTAGPSSMVAPPESRPSGSEDDCKVLANSSLMGATGTSMEASGKVLLGKQGPNVTAIPWPHAMFMDKEAEGGSVTDMAVSPKENGRFVATGCEDCVVRIWDTGTGTATKLIKHDDTVWAVAFNHDGTKLVSGGGDNKAILWDVEHEQVITELVGHTGDVWVLAYSPDGSRIATGSTDSNVKLWDGANGSEIATLSDHDSIVMMITFSPDSKRLATCADHRAVVYDAEKGTLVSKLEGHKGIVWAMDFSPDSSRIVTAAEDGAGRIWNVATGEVLCIVQEHTGPLWTACFSPDGKEIAVGGFDCTVAICDSFTGERHHMLGTENPVIIDNLAYAAQGDVLAAGCADGAVKLWDARTGERIAEFQGHEDKAKKVLFNPDGRQLFSGSDDGTVRKWDVVDVLRL